MPPVPSWLPVMDSVFRVINWLGIDRAAAGLAGGN